MFGSMLFGSPVEALMRLARAAIASLLLVGVPLADAVACGGEDFATVSESSADVETPEAVGAVAAQHDDHSQAPDDGQHCIHGHCHHATTLRGDEAKSGPVSEAQIEVAALPTSVAVSRIAHGLERPPKA